MWVVRGLRCCELGWACVEVCNSYRKNRGGKQIVNGKNKACC